MLRLVQRLWQKLVKKWFWKNYYLIKFKNYLGWLKRFMDILSFQKSNYNSMISEIKIKVIKEVMLKKNTWIDHWINKSICDAIHFVRKSETDSKRDTKLVNF